MLSDWTPGLWDDEKRAKGQKVNAVLMYNWYETL